MQNNYIIRADFYSNGQILPLSITTIEGKTTYIKNILSTKVEVLQNGLNKHSFVCCTNNGILSLVYVNNHWFFSTKKH